MEEDMNGRHWMLLGPCALLLGTAACGGLSTQSGPCAALQGQSVEGASISARHVAAAAGVPEHCEVKGSLPPALDFQLWLPSDWNGKALFAGGGGFDGVIADYTYLAYATSRYAVIASNGGHTGEVFDGSFALDPVKFDDFASLSTHRVLPVARALVRAFYGRDATRAYFEGCSNGGREALIEAQRWPEDFDGIIARAPAYDFTELALAFNRHAQQLSQPGASLSDAKLASLGQASLAACDAQDGLVDGVLSNPAACAFDPAALQCQGAESDACLTAAQLASVRTVYSPYVLNGQKLYEGWPAGGENDPDAWAAWITGHGTPSAAIGSIFGREFVRYIITQQPSADPLTFQPGDWLPRIQQVSAQLSANSADLSGLRARGAKLVLWHGGTDAAISQKGTAAYYDRVVQAAGDQKTADGFVEYFPAPGVNHCQGGAGPDAVDLLSALDAWVERGTPPSSQGLTIRKLNAAGQSALSRPLCKYPRYPRYNGTGDVTQATSFTCAAP
jgi:hypothetical protein